MKNIKLRALCPILVAFYVCVAVPAFGGEYVEPKTGATVAYPDMFNGKVEDGEGVYKVWAGEPGNIKGRLEISVGESTVLSVYEMLAGIYSSIEYKDASPWSLRALSRNHAVLVREDDSLWLVDMGWMLADGRYLRVRALVRDEETLGRVCDGVKVAFPNDQEKALMQEIAYTHPYRELTGVWTKEGGGPVLEVFSDKLFRFINPAGETLAYAMYHDNYKELRAWKMGASPKDVEELTFSAEPGQPFQLAFTREELAEWNGAYTLTEKPFTWGEQFYGKWVTPSGRHTLSIGPQSLTHSETYKEDNTTRNFVRGTNYVERREGLAFFDREDRPVLVRKTKDGLTLDGVADLFSRENEPVGMYTFMAAKADLSAAPGLVLEPDTPPQNLGGWVQTGDIRVRFPFSVPMAARYKVVMFCSRASEEDAVVLFSVGDGEDQRVQATVPGTGSWADYVEVEADSTLSLPAGDLTLEIETGDPSRGDHLMNLRAVKLILVE